ncbi:hypothetical protein SHO565_51950 [Streptomyces sp. HO565]
MRGANLRALCGCLVHRNGGGAQWSKDTLWRYLTEASAHATALVVGTCGLGGFLGIPLGSVSQGVLHHAGRPVITVPLRQRQ